MFTSNETDLRGDERAVSEVLGAILVFGIVMALLALVQSTAIPVANQQIEFEHSKRVVGDLHQFDESVGRAALDGTPSATSVEAGVRYPPRLFLRNPSPVTGSLTTDGAGELRLEGFEAVDAESAEYLDAGVLAFETTSLTYRPGYNEYATAPELRYENGVLFSRYEHADVLQNEGQLVAGRRIRLVALDGAVSTASVDPVSLEADPVSGPAQRVTVRGAGGAAPSIVVTTALSEDTWRDEILAAEFDAAGAAGNDRYVTEIECLEAVPSAESCDGQLRLTFEPGVTYSLSMAKVAVGAAADGEEPRYLTTVGVAAPALDPAGTDLTVELRDRFNNPVDGRDVSFEITGGAASLSESVVTTDEAGRATVRVTPGTGTDPVSVLAYYDADESGDFNEGPELAVEYTGLPHASSTSESTGGLRDINSQRTDVVLTSVSLTDSGSGHKGDRMTAHFENRGTDDWRFTEARISFVLATGDVTEAVVTQPPSATTLATLEPKGEFEPLTPDVTFTPGATRTLQFDFDASIEGGGTPFDGLAVITFAATNDDTGETIYQTYFLTD